MADWDNIKILYIEDDYMIGQMYTDYLRKQGFNVTLETDGGYGLATARDEDYELILLDIMLPNQNGDRVLESLRNKEDLIPNSKIIILTNFSQSKEAKEDLTGKVEAYLVKTDTTPTDLLAKIKEVLELE